MTLKSKLKALKSQLKALKSQLKALNPKLKALRSTLTLALLLLLTACTANKQLRTDPLGEYCEVNGSDCTQAVIERYPDHDLGFIEFTERGNLYDRESLNEVLRLVKRQSESEHGAAVFVFVHGWKHNARHDDSNVVQFREFLSRAAENEVVGRRKVIGLYLGWRGAFTEVPVLKEATYWARKSVAEEVGAGGATEVFAKLHQILVAQPAKQLVVSESGSLQQSEKYKNSFVIIGHSFGGAIVLSALHDVLLNNLVAANTSISNEPQHCDRVSRFADALILLNPAIEANKVVLLKEAAARCLFQEDQPPLMHVLSSDGDNATKVFFPMGQYLNIASPLGPKKLKRSVQGKEIVLDERKLGLVTAGNLRQLRTSYLKYDKSDSNWLLSKCSDDLSSCGLNGSKQQRNHFTVNQYDPLRFIKTDRVFIKNHNDAFGCYVQGFISSLVMQAQSVDLGFNQKDSPQSNLSSTQEHNACAYSDGEKFNLMGCFNRQIEEYDCELP